MQYLNESSPKFGTALNDEPMLMNSEVFGIVNNPSILNYERHGIKPTKPPEQS